MNYRSTRDNNCTVSAAQAIFQGISVDGGLFVPQETPKVSADIIAELAGKSYIERAKYILGLYLADFTAEEIEKCVTNAYDGKFDDNIPAPLSAIVGGQYFLELWHGPTCAFKDMALQLLPELLTVSMDKVGDGKTAVILVATSGDTGKAALEGFRDVKNTKMMVFYPENGVSPMQKRQMYTQQGYNLSVVAINGNFDDAQTGVKKIFADKAYVEALEKDGYVLSSANSINWGRLLPQIVYYFSSYCDMISNDTIKNGDVVNYCVPTGNFGNILAAHYARKMGLPIGKLICASNSNNVLTQAIMEGVYNKEREFFATNSPSMDILISSNFERMIYELLGCESDKTKAMMESLSSTGSYTLPQDAIEMLQKGFWADYCDEEETLATIKNIFDSTGYLCDTHTAVAAAVADKYVKATGDNAPMVVVSTASPYKFVASVLDAVGADYNADDDFAMLDKLYEVSAVRIPDGLASLKTAERRFSINCDADKMVDELSKFLKSEI